MPEFDVLIERNVEQTTKIIVEAANIDEAIADGPVRAKTWLRLPNMSGKRATTSRAPRSTRWSTTPAKLSWGAEMAMTKSELKDWLDTLFEDSLVTIDEGGLSLVEIRPRRHRDQRLP